MEAKLFKMFKKIQKPSGNENEPEPESKTFLEGENLSPGSLDFSID
jgi:hypothetical protein